MLPLAECARLLATAGKRGLTGRLAVSTDQAPLVQPVNFTYHDHQIVVRLGPGHLTDVIAGTLVAFEVDHVDRDAREAWSVLVRGLATPVEESGSVPGADVSPTPLVPVPGSMRFEVRLDVVTGRRFPLDGFDDPAGRAVGHRNPASTATAPAH